MADTLHGAAQRHRGINALPDMFGPVTARLQGRLHWTHWLLIAAVLLPPLVITAWLQTRYGNQVWHEHIAHSLVEAFCALMSLSVFYILHAEYRFSGNRRLCFMSYGFLAMGLCGFAHAFVESGTNLFVWYHSIAILTGALFLAASLLVRVDVRSESCATTAAVAGMLIGLVVLSYVGERWVPAMKNDGEFTAIAWMINTLAAALLAWVGYSYLRSFRHSGEPILLVFSLGMFLLAQSAAIFPFSALWDATWWAWHSIKTAIFVAIAVGLAYEFVHAFAELQSSRREILIALTAVEERNRSIEARNRELSAQAGILESMSRSLEVAAVLDSIVSAVRDLFGFRHCCILEEKTNGGLRIMAADRHHGTAVPPCADRLRAAPCDRVAVWRAGAIWTCTVPLMVRGHHLGWLCAESDAPPDAEVIAKLSMFGNEAAIALENATLHQVLVKRHRDLQTVHSILRHLVSSIELAELLRVVARKMGESLAVPRVLIYRLEAERRVLRVVAEYDDAAERGCLGREFMQADHPVIAGWDMDHTRTLFVRAAPPPPDPHGVLRAEAGGRRLVGMLYLRLACGAAGGVMAIPLPQGAGRDSFSDDEVQLAQTVADEASIALHNAWLFDRVRRESEFKEALNRVTLALGASRDLDAVLAMVGQESITLLGVDAVLLGLLDNTGRTLAGNIVVAQPGLARASWRRPLEEMPELVREALETRRPICRNDLQAGAAGFAALDERLVARSVLVVPLLGIRGALGVMVLVAHERPHHFDAELVAHAESFAHQAANALETARLIQELLVAYEELEAAQASLVESERLASLAEMAARVAHEIRNPLGAITNCLDLLRDDKLSAEEREEIVAITESEVDRLNAIVSETLASTRKHVCAYQPVDLPALVERTIGGMRPQDLGEARIVSGMAASPLPPVLGDPHKLQQVVWNLTLNAVQAMRHQGVVRIDMREDDGAVVLTVRDEGPGLPEIVCRHMFEPFFSTKPGGTGLGLSVVRRIVHDHGGSVTAGNHPEGGAEIVVRLPSVQRTAVEPCAAEALVTA